MKVDDETLDYVKNWLGLSVGEYAKVDAVVAELMALRKVAEAAAVFADYVEGRGRRQLLDALKEAGYDA